jgi:hypothetical protein
MAKCPKCRDGRPHHFPHNLTGYAYHSCRCEICTRAANNFARRSERGKKILAAAEQDQRRQKPRADRRQYLREYYRANRERILLYCRGHGRTLEEGRKYRDDNRESIAAYKREYYKANRERMRELNRAWCARNADRRSESAYRYGQRNGDYLRKQSKKKNERRKAIPSPRDGQPYTAEDDITIMRDDLRLTEMCSLLGRSYSSIGSRRRRLREQIGHIAPDTSLDAPRRRRSVAAHRPRNDEPARNDEPRTEREWDEWLSQSKRSRW